MSQYLLSKRNRVVSLGLAVAIVVIALFVSSVPAAHAVGASAYVTNSSTSTCDVSVRRYDASAPGNFRAETVKPGKTSVYKGYAVSISSTCKARWSGTNTYTSGPAVMAVSQTTTRTIYAVKK